MITTASDYKQALQESERDIFGNKTWGQAFANLDYSRQAAQSQIAQTYGEDIARAYEAATAQRASIGGSALGQGVKDILQNDVSTALSAAYDKYMANMQSNQNTLAANIEKSYKELNKQLEERATKFSEFDREHYNYLGYVLDQLQKGEDQAAYDKFISNPLWNKFFNVDELGTATLRSWEDLTRPVYDEQAGEYVSFYDAEGQLTSYGRDFYNLVENYYENQMPVGGETLPPSFAEYLYTENPDLYKYINEDNVYSLALNSFGENKNLGAFRQVLGIRSDADQYNFLENLGGLTPQQLYDTFGDIDRLVERANKGETISLNEFDAVYEKMKKDFKTLGITDVNWAEADKQIKQLGAELESAQQAKHEADVTGTVFLIAAVVGTIAGIVLLATGVGAPAGASLLGSSATSLAAGLTTEVAATSLAAGLTTVSSAGHAKTIDEASKALRQTYLDALTAALSGKLGDETGNQQTEFGGKLAAKLNAGRGPQTLEEYSSSNMSADTFATNTKAKSSKRADFAIKDIGSGIKNDHFDLVIGSGDSAKTFRLVSSGNRVTDSKQEQYLNNYATGNKDTYPKLNTPVVVGGKMYLFTQKGWMPVNSAADSVDDAVRAFLGKKN